MVDAHCHLQDRAFDADRDAVVERALAAGIERLLVPGYDLASSRAAVELAAARPELVRAAVGIHPHYASAADDASWDELASLTGEPGVVAVGEIGLDYHRNLSPPQVQRDAFRRQLALAAGAGLPVIVHDREAHTDVTAALLDWVGPGRDGADGVRGVLHAFSGDATMARALVEAGFLCSFALPVAFRSATGPRAAAAALPDGSFLVETDSPWLAPGTGQRNEPTTVLRVAAELAALRSTTPGQVAASVRAAFDRLVGA
jgi:TatD DNase family protein